MNIKRAETIWLAVGAAATLIGCGGTAVSDAVTGEGMHLTLDVGALSGVSGIHFEVVPVGCLDGAPVPGSVPLVADRDISDLGIPGGISELNDNPLDKNSSHAFADHFVTVPAGCYDVTTAPVSKTLRCHAASKMGVKVNAGKTTEVFLINQCEGTDPGALDTISAINHPPTLVDVSFRASKFVASCGPQVICATARDVDADPLEFVFAQSSGPTAAGPVVVSQAKNADGSITQCVRYTPQAAGRYGLSVTVYDMLHDGTAFRRIEDWLAAQGYANPSHATLEFPFYATLGRTPVKEVCGDGIDNDCDGEIDDKDECIPIGPKGCPDGTAPICGGTIDMMLLEDLSGSFTDDAVTVKALAPTLASSLKAANPGVQFGVASFVDKPFLPFGSAAAGDYVFKLHLPLTAADASFVSATAGLVVRVGGDVSEAQFEALGLLANNAGPAGFRAGAKHFVVLATDATPHLAGDCSLAVGGCVTANNGDGIADLLEDYPSEAQLITELNAADITPVFAVAGGSFERAPYEALVSTIGRGRVVTLSPDSSNLVNAIFSGMGDTCTCAPR